MSYGTDGLTFNTLRNANVVRCKESFKSNLSDWSHAEWLQALVGEVGEYANFAKKHLRGDLTRGQFLDEARKELADVQCYLDLLAASLDIDLGEATMEKFNAVSLRVGSDIYIDADDWHRRAK